MRIAGTNTLVVLQLNLDKSNDLDNIISRQILG